MGIQESRKEIDRIDQQIIHLLNLRAETAIRLGPEKQSAGLPVCDPEREREILERIPGRNTGPFDSGFLALIFRQVIRESRRLEESASAQPRQQKAGCRAGVGLCDKRRVGFQGERGAYSEQAAIHLLGHDIECVARPTFEALFAAVREGAADYVLAPIENSLVGSVQRCCDLLLEADLRIVAEINLPIGHCLVGPPGATFQQVTAVESHPVALAQCEGFFAAYPHIRRVASEDTAGSVRDVVRRADPTCAAIGPERAAEIYGGCVLRKHLEDHAENYTRFLLLSPSPSQPKEANKLSLVMQLPHRPGALFRALQPFARREINLGRIESRPVQGRPWHYRFYLDLAASPQQPEVSDALAELQDRAESVQILGWYPAAQEVYGD